MSTNNKEPGETLAVVLNVVALCVIGWTVLVSFVVLYFQFFQFLPLQFGVRTYYQRWGGLARFPVMHMQYVVMGVLIGLVLFALGAIIRAINANTRELRKIREALKTAASK